MIIGIILGSLLTVFGVIMGIKSIMKNRNISFGNAIIVILKWFAIIGVVFGLCTLLDFWYPIEFKSKDGMSSSGTSWSMVGLVLVVLYLVIRRIGNGKIKDGLKVTGELFLNFVIAIIISAVVGVGPVMAVEFGWPWWAMTILFLAQIGGIIVSIGGAENAKSETGYTFFQQFVKIGVPSLVSAVVLLIVHWMESWNVDSFWGGVGVFFIAVIAIAAASVALRTALTMLLTFHPINIVNALVYAYLGFFTGVMMFTTCLEICPAAGWLALLGFTGGFATGGEDLYAYDVNGRKAKRTGSNEFTTEDGTKYKKMQSGWGEDFKRE